VEAVGPGRCSVLCSHTRVEGTRIFFQTSQYTHLCLMVVPSVLPQGHGVGLPACVTRCAELEARVLSLLSFLGRNLGLLHICYLKIASVRPSCALTDTQWYAAVGMDQAAPVRFCLVLLDDCPTPLEIRVATPKNQRVSSLAEGNARVAMPTVQYDASLPSCTWCRRISLQLFQLSCSACLKSL
jgi:hypothetical protein